MIAGRGAIFAIKKLWQLASFITASLCPGVQIPGGENPNVDEAFRGRLRRDLSDDAPDPCTRFGSELMCCVKIHSTAFNVTRNGNIYFVEFAMYGTYTIAS